MGGGESAGRDDAIRAELVAWYHAHRRDLPWRRTRDPYSIWLSEVVCQQTRVATAIPYYETFLATFPTVRDLSEAPLDRVLALWSGLGYYARARNFHAAARMVTDAHGGRLPGAAAAFGALPGVGAYTTAAVLSIAFGVPLAAVDGNVRRVLSRLDDLENPSPAQLQGRASELLDVDDAGSWNQAVMELGALVCTPKSPQCEACPLSGRCLARRRGTVSIRPAARAKTRVRDVHVAAVWDSTADGVLLERRPGGTGIWAGLWMTPLVEFADGGDPVASCAEEGLVRAAMMTEKPVVHVLTHRRIHIYPVTGTWSTPGLRRVPPDRWGELGVPAALHRLREWVE